MTLVTTKHIRSSSVISSESVEINLSDYIAAHVRYDTSHLKKIESGHSVKATACIYCGSGNNLTKEHIIPHALNGTLTIAKGSCGECQKITHRFEAAILRGELQELRYKLKTSSRTKHKFTSNKSDIDSSPVVVAFPVFPLPKYFDETTDPGIKPENLLIVGSGGLPEDFSHELMPIEFARMIAKIAYSFAWSTKLLDVIENPHNLVKAFMHDTSVLGRFVGTRRPPYRIADSDGHILTASCVPEKKVVYVNVQLLAHKGTPTYIVALGDLKKGLALRQGDRPGASK